MTNQDILLWDDGFWCLREEFNPGFLRGENWRVVPYDSEEWHRLNQTGLIASMRAAK
jgi:hypothetical protein